MSLNYSNQELHWNAHSLVQVAKKWRNLKEDFPLYLYSRKILQDRFQLFQKSFPKARIHFAVKSNHWQPLLKELKNLGSHVDVVSFGEAEAALEAGFTPEQILFSGVGKTKKELESAIKIQVYQINIEGDDELNRIIEIDQPVRVGLRWTPGLDAKTHPFIKTGHLDTKFGMSESDLLAMIEKIKKYPKIQLQGLSMHLGSQIQDMQDFKAAYLALKDLVNKCQTDFKNIDLGGGLGIFYESQDLNQDEKLLTEYKKVIDEVFFDSGLQILFEPGRFISARAGGLLTEVQAVKSTPKKKIIVVDAGMHQLIRPVLYEAYHGVFPLAESLKLEKADVVGPICESSDFLALDREVGQVQVKDLLWIADTGAYGSSMASRYNLRPEAKEVFIEDII